PYPGFFNALAWSDPTGPCGKECRDATLLYYSATLLYYSMLAEAAGNPGPDDVTDPNKRIEIRSHNSAAEFNKHSGRGN
ncbi:MAG: hypothetical protein DMG06_27890, partial [Acidobacteria bacterium]